MRTFDILLKFLNEKLWLAVFIFCLYVRACEKKKGFLPRCLGGLAGLAVLGLLPYFLPGTFPGLQVLMFLAGRNIYVWSVIIALYMGVIFRCSWNMKILSAIAGLCVQETLFGCWALVSILLPTVNTDLGELLFVSAGGVLAAAALYRFLALKITPRKLQMLQQRSLLPLIALYLLAALMASRSLDSVFFFMLGFEQLKAALPSLISLLERVRLSVVAANIAGNVIVLLALANMLRYSEADLERELLEQIREQDRKQFTHFRSNVDYINTKSHDLKHYLDLIRTSQTIPPRELEEVSASILQLDSETDSGNETLDMILTDRRLVCAGKGIDLIFQTDGTRLEQLDTVDTFGIFCNILDNAIGYVEQLPPEERSIRLGIRTVHSMVFIHQENPFAGELVMKDGLPVTTQSDETRHGFGLKSVQATVKRCGGSLSIRAEHGRFELDICFFGSTGKQN